MAHGANTKRVGTTSSSQGIEIAKCIALGANLGGIAGDFLRAAVSDDGVRAVVELSDTITQELRIAMFCAGAENLEALAKTPLYPAFS